MFGLKDLVKAHANYYYSINTTMVLVWLNQQRIEFNMQVPNICIYGYFM